MLITVGYFAATLMETKTLVAISYLNYTENGTLCSVEGVTSSSLEQKDLQAELKRVPVVID